MLALNKIKAALPGRLSHFTNNTEEHITAICLVNLSRSTGAANYGKSPQRLTVWGMRRWRSAQSPNFSGDLQSAEKAADTWLAEKPADRKRWLGFESQILTKEISSLDKNHRIISQFFGKVPSCYLYGPLSLLTKF